MLNIAKSYLKSYFKNWVISLTVIFCMLIIFVVFIGGISTPYQFKNYYDNVKQKSNLWNYNLYDNDSDVTDDFIYKYFYTCQSFLNTKQDQVKTNQIILDNTNVGIKNSQNLTWSSYLQNFSTDTEKKEAISYVIKSNLSFHYGGNYQLKLKDSSKYNISTKNITIFQVFNSYWLKKLNFLNNDNKPIYQNYSLLKFFLNQIYNKNNINYNYSVDYSIYKTDVKNKNYFLLTSYNYNKINNVISNYKNNIDMDSIIISSNYAKNRNLKIGDYINVLNFITDPTLYKNFNIFHKYKIVGFGNNISNLEPINAFSSFNHSINNYANIYFNDAEFSNIISLMQSTNIKNQYNSSNFQYYVSNNFKINFNNFQLINKKSINKIIDNPKWYDFDSLSFNVDFKQTNIEVIIFIIITIVTLFISFIFFSFIINRDVQSTIRQIGIFKSFGYTDLSLSWLLSFKVFLTIFISSFLGFFISIPIQLFMKNTFSKNITFYIHDIWFNPYFILILWIIIPALFTIFSIILIFKIINKKPSSLLNVDSINKNSKFNIYISKIFHKTNFIFKLNILYAIRNKYKLLIVFIIFTFCIFLSVVQINSLSLFKSISYQFNGIYNKEVDHLNYFKTPNNSLIYINNHFKNKNKKLLNFVDMDKNNNSIIQSANKNRILIKDIAKNINELTSEHINGFAIYLNDLDKLINFLPDKFTAKYKNEINLFKNKILNPEKTIIVINKYAYNSKFTSLNTVLKMNYYTNIRNHNTIQKRTNLYLINKNTLNYLNFNKNNVKGDFNQIFNNNSYSTNVVISSSLSNRANLSINSQFSTFKVSNNKKYTFKMNVVGIYKTDKFKDKIYLDSSNFKKKYFDQPNSLFYNYAISKNKEIIGNYNINNLSNNIKFNQPYLNYYLDYNNISDNTTLNSLSNNNFEYQGFLNCNPILQGFNLNSVKNTNIPLINNIISYYLNSIITIFTLLEIIIFIILTMIMVVLVNITIDETKRFIMILKAAGYKKKNINFIVMNSFIFVSTFALIFAFIGNYIFWKFIKSFLFNKYLFTITIPHSIIVNVSILLSFILIIMLSWFAGYNKINKKNITKLNE